MSLKISLRPGEMVAVNGAVLTSIGRAEMLVEGQANILRGRDVMSPEEAVTPASRLYFSCMMAYIDPGHRTTHQEHLAGFLEDLMAALQAPEARVACVRNATHAARGDYYMALGECRRLIAYEHRLLEPQQLDA